MTSWSRLARYSTSSQFAASRLRNNRRILHPPRPHQAFADAIYKTAPSLVSHSTEDAVNNILYNTPPPNRSPVNRHVLNCLVSNEPGVLSRVSGVLAGRGFNIDSLVVAKTEVPDLSRMTIVLRGQDKVVEQARRQLEDIVPVWAVLDYTHSKVVERELLLVKIAAIPPEHLHHQTQSKHSKSKSKSHNSSETKTDIEENEALAKSLDSQLESLPIPPLVASSVHRQAIMNLAELFKARVVDVSMDSITVELSAKSERINAFLKLCRPYGIIEAARSGTMAMPRSKVEGIFSTSEDLEENIEDDLEDDVAKVDATLLPPG